jgi:hypothetical protein
LTSFLAGCSAPMVLLVLVLPVLLPVLVLLLPVLVLLA